MHALEQMGMICRNDLIVYMECGRRVTKPSAEFIKSVERHRFTGGVICWKCERYVIITTTTTITNYNIMFLKTRSINISLSDRLPLAEGSTKCVRCCAIAGERGFEWAYYYCRDELGIDWNGKL